ncbi:MAG TPA: DUF2254 domain-containing protein [Polyangiaceae bacterium]|nr:DUF2254 domain-containing protein [Polyangiaceae bacterium]
MHQVRNLWQALQGSLWFLPALMLCASVAAAVGLVELQSMVDVDLSQRWPRLFGAGAEGARGMLSAIATSMATVAGVVFSITVVALSLAASQYSPRVLRNFMSDRATQAVLGAFVSIFTYCLVVLRTVRGPDEGAFVPSLAVLGGMAMAFVGVFLLIFFVHHVASTIQVSSILERIAGETLSAITRLFPDTLGAPAVEPALEPAVDSRAHAEEIAVVVAPSTGYLVSVDGEALLGCAERRSIVVELVPAVGDFIVAALPLVRVKPAARLDDATRNALRACFVIDRQRTVAQDVPFGFQQIVDIGMKALSPGVNDPTTAVACIDHLGALLVAMADRRVPAASRATGGVLRVVARGPDFDSMLSLAFDAIGEHAADHVEVHERLVATIGRIAGATVDGARRTALARQLEIVVACAARAGVPAHRQARFDALCDRERRRIADRPPKRSTRTEAG